jgi:hypothetical protein
LILGPRLPARHCSKRKKHARRLDETIVIPRPTARRGSDSRPRRNRPPRPSQPTPTAIRTTAIMVMIVPIMKAYAISRPRLLMVWI